MTINSRLKSCKSRVDTFSDYFFYILPCPIEFKIVNEDEIAKGKNTKVHKIKAPATQPNIFVHKPF